MGSVQLRFGDIFDGPTDLIVLPCSTVGTVTPFVRDKLERHKIAVRPSGSMSLGDVEIHPFEGGQSIASYVAYAASVAIIGSSVRSIQDIGCRLGEFTKKNDAISTISIPLLGTGAGGLRPGDVFEALKESFLSSSSQTATLIVSVISRQSFSELSGSSQSTPANFDLRGRQIVDTTPPRVFISYSHTSSHHANWVQKFGEFLRQNGVDARLDIWFLHPGMDLPQFMTNELMLADRVIVICDEKYAEKADGRLGGVGWETMIIQGDMSQQPVSSKKYMAVVRSPILADGTPIYLKSKMSIHWPPSVDEGPLQHKMLQEIFNTVRAPPIGRRPSNI